MRGPYRRTVLLLVALPSLGVGSLHSQEPRPPAQVEKPIVVMVEKAQGRVTYKVEPRQAPAKDALEPA